MPCTCTCELRKLVAAYVQHSRSRTGLAATTTDIKVCGVHAGIIWSVCCVWHRRAVQSWGKFVSRAHGVNTVKIDTNPKSYTGYFYDKLSSRLRYYTEMRFV